MYFRYFVIISPWKKAWPFICPSLEDDMWQVWLQLAHWFCRRRLLKFVNVFPLILISLLGKGGDFHLKKLKSPSLKDALCHVWWNWPTGSVEEDFKILSMYFRYFDINSPWKRAWPFIWTNLNSIHPRMHCAKFCWNWPFSSREEKMWKVDGDGQRTNCDQKSPLEPWLRWAKNTTKHL